MEIPLHAEVVCSDGSYGESTYVIVDPRTGELTHLVVEENELPSYEHLVPVDMVIESNPDRILLRCTRQELSEMKPFLRDAYLPGTAPYLGYPPDGYMTWPAIAAEFPQPLEVSQNPPGTLAVEHGAHVDATDGGVGEVDELLIDPVTNRVTHIIIDTGVPWDRKKVTIPVDQIDRIEDNVVKLKLSKDAIAHLPRKPSSKSEQR